METIAVYWEPRIKIYGFGEKDDLSLFRLDLPAGQLARWGQQIESAAGSGFFMINGQMTDMEAFRLQLLTDRATGDRCRPLLERAAEGKAGGQLQVDQPVELIYFQGPHFGDRYGIADAALGTLAAQGMPVLAAGCTGASIYIVVPENMSRQAIAILSEPFATPRTDDASG